MRQMLMLAGFQPQALAQISNLQVNSFNSPLLINVTGPQRGAFITVGCQIRSANFAGPFSALDVRIRYAMDGALSPTDFPLFRFDGTALENYWSYEALAASSVVVGDGSNLNDTIVLFFGLVFQSAAVIIISCNAAPDPGNARLMNFYCNYAFAPPA